MSAEKFHGIFDQYYRSGKNFVRLPVTPEPVELENPVLNQLLFQYEDSTLENNWALNPEEVSQWTQTLASGRIPAGCKSREEFENFVRKKCQKAFRKKRF